MHMPSTRTVSLVGVVVLGVLLASVVAPQVRARQPQPGGFQSKHLTLAPVITGLTEPTYVAGAPDGSGRFFVLERAGLVRVADAKGVVQPSPFLDLTQQVSLSNEEGLLSLAFHPAFTRNGYVYVSYTALDLSVQVVRYTISPDHPDVVDPSTAQVVLAVPKRSKYHNGGMLAFGPDSYLYVSVGDDEASERAQDLGSLTGKILRLDVDSSQPYTIPPNNPFVGSDARGEVWASGLRNPWRFSFDRATGDMWIGDVHHVDGEAGQDWEAVDFQPASSTGGENYGFPMQATFHCADIATCQPPGVTLPVSHYSHNMNCSVTGGYVYRGKSAPPSLGHTSSATTAPVACLRFAGARARVGQPASNWDTSPSRSARSAKTRMVSCMWSTSRVARFIRSRMARCHRACAKSGGPEVRPTFRLGR